MDNHILQDYLDGLNDEQREAATLGNESAVILAAAGSGKTSTLTCRIAYLISGLGVRPDNIMAVTFTNKAAKEMVSRLNKMGLDSKHVWVGTFHGICNKILRYHATEAGLKRNFMILDRQEQETFFKRVLRSNGYDPKAINASDLLDKINNYKESGWRSNQLRVNSIERKIYELYEEACLRDNCVDFGELLLGCYELFLNNQQIADFYAEKFCYILVDEFQDTNELQYRWLKLLAKKHKNIFAVGDDDQFFVAGTKIETPKGSYPIESFKEGDEVFSRTQFGKEVGRVLSVKKNAYYGDICKIRFKNGKMLEVTPNHVLFALNHKKSIETHKDVFVLGGGVKDYPHFSYSVGVHGSGHFLKDVTDLSFTGSFLPKAKLGIDLTDFVSASDLQEGSLCYDLNGELVEVVKVSVIKKQTTVYDLNVDVHHNYCANGIMVHNSIYSFRGAKPENMNLLKKEFNAKVIKIEKNYRSDANILSAANAVIKNNKNRQGKNLVPTIAAKNHLLSYNALNDEEESSFIASEIKKLRRANIYFKNMAILYRTNGQSRSIEKALNAYGVPYIVYGGFRFFDRQEVKHAMAYLRLAHNPNDNLAFLRVANIPVRSIGDTTVKKLEVLAAEKKVSLYAAVEFLDEKTKKKFLPFIELVDHLVNSCKNKSLPDMVKRVIVGSGLEDMYQKDNKEGPERLDNLYELISAAEVFVIENKNADIEEFLAFSSLETDINSNKRDENADAVKLMTVHSSKGLEFDVVFISGLEESLFPHANSLMDLSLVEEERRLMYVAITRAKKALYLSCSEERLLHGQRTRFIKSRFFREIPQELMKKIK